jgi:hypothetical protein
VSDTASSVTDAARALGAMIGNTITRHMAITILSTRITSHSMAEPAVDDKSGLVQANSLTLEIPISVKAGVHDSTEASTENHAHETHEIP